MASSSIDSRVFGVLFASEDMKKFLAMKIVFKKWLDTKAAFARAQAKLCIITKHQAKQITKFAKARLLDIDVIGKNYKSSITIVPLLKEFKKVFDDDSGEFVHWGATSQDIMDNGLVPDMSRKINLFICVCVGYFGGKFLGFGDLQML